MTQDTDKKQNKVLGSARRAGYTAAGAALGSAAGRALGWWMLGPIGYRIGQTAGAVAGGALGFQLSSTPAEPGHRTAEREGAVVKLVPETEADVVDAVFE